MVLLARCGSVIATLGALGWMLGCASVPSFAANPHDAGLACSDAQPCPSGQSCLQGLCYAACDMTHPCSAREMCRSGVCVSSATDAGPPPHDVGMDGGPCVTLNCTAPAICRGDIAACVACDQTHQTCGGGTSVCDVGRGDCTAFVPGICAPCNTNADCPSMMTCITRGAPDPVERVCLPACSTGGTCTNPGFVCTSGTCTPFVTSCTVYASAVASRPCAMDSDCPQLGASVDNGLVTGMCFAPTGGGPMTCHAACGTTADCPSGRTCMAAPPPATFHFCQ